MNSKKPVENTQTGWNASVPAVTITQGGGSGATGDKQRGEQNGQGEVRATAQ